MKKLLAILAATALITPVVTSVISCGENQEPFTNNPLMIGKGIDKSKAIDDSQPGKFGFTNFYIVGDSLSDTDGISNLIKTKFANQMVDLNVSLSGAYGYEKNDVHYSAFSNGMTAGTILSEKLGFGEMKPSNFLSKKESTNYGKNYSVGGATAAKLDLPTGILLNDATIDRQTEALLSQHKINNNDLVFFEIGGNDLFSLIGFEGNEAKQVEFMNDSIDRVRTALFNLLNNGIKNIIFMTPPRMDFPPRYRDIFNEANAGNSKAKKTAEFIINICDEYYSKIMNVLNEVEQYYPDSIELYDLYKKTNELENEFKKIAGQDAIIDKAYSDGQAIEIKLNNEKMTFNTDPKLDLFDNVSSVINEFKSDIVFGAKNTLDITISATRSTSRSLYNNNERDKDMSKFFFTDFVHPTKQVHELVSEILLDHAKELSKKWEN